jgi:hypothetical protein
MPPQQAYRLLDLVDKLLSFRAHLGRLVGVNRDGLDRRGQ